MSFLLDAVVSRIEFYNFYDKKIYPEKAEEEK